MGSSDLQPCSLGTRVKRGAEFDQMRQPLNPLVDTSGAGDHQAEEGGLSGLGQPRGHLSQQTGTNRPEGLQKAKTQMSEEFGEVMDKVDWPRESSESMARLCLPGERATDPDCRLSRYYQTVERAL